ncbi:MAG: SpaA isopeptide-forming pilin-related protein [Oscillospiraceae bacterium]|nr:SpaA isopeptide-forming pilin-related protein [Oscillospiraceae bacterium]
MRKSNLLKSTIMFVLMFVMVMAAAVTAYAETDGTDIDYEYINPTSENGTYENGEDEPTETPTQDEPPLGSLVIINSTHDGVLLHGAVFAVYRVGETTRLVELATDTTGRTIEFPLPQGNYNIVIVLPAHNHAPITNVVGTTITAGQRQKITIFSVPTQPQTPGPPPPPVDSGRLIITLRAQGTGQLLSGAMFELRRAMDGEFVAFLVTDTFGEAAIDLPIGDYFVREVQAVRGFIPNPDRVNVRIAANRLNELNLTSRPEPEPTPPPQQDPPPQPGRLVITARADGTPIHGAIFEVRRAMDNRLVAELITDRFGEAAVSLMPDDYFLRQLHAPQGIEFDTERVNVRIAAGAIREVSITNRTPATTTPPAQTPTPEVLYGRLLITAISSDSRDRLEGVVYTIHDVMTDEVITTIATNAFGEASALLPPGQYFKRNALMPQGYRRDMERINFTIRAGAVSNMTVTASAIPQPTPEPTPQPTLTPTQTPRPPATTTPAQPATPARPTQNRVDIITRTEKSGNPLHGATFAVYRAVDNQRVGEVTTDAQGRATISLGAGEYYLRNNSVQFGFLRERSRIFFTVGTSDVSVDITIQRDPNIPYADYGVINLPQTGELPPVMNYVLGVLFLAVALLCGVVILTQQTQKSIKGKGVKAYAKPRYRRKAFCF